jgi:hypothetical protein
MQKKRTKWRQNVSLCRAIALAAGLFSCQAAWAEQINSGGEATLTAPTLNVRQFLTRESPSRAVALSDTGSLTGSTSLELGATPRDWRNDSASLNVPAGGVFAANPTKPRVDPGPMPPQVGPTQQEIEREARRLRLGLRGGVALDPELIMIGVQSLVGPVVRSDVFFRPSVEFGLGEVTAMFGFNGEIIYRLARSPEQRFSTYFGAGLGINLLHQNFEGEEDGRRIDFGDFHSDSALNILGGVSYSSGVFLELKTSVYSEPSPTLRFTVGYNF